MDTCFSNEILYTGCFINDANYLMVHMISKLKTLFSDSSYIKSVIAILRRYSIFHLGTV